MHSSELPRLSHDVEGGGPTVVLLHSSVTDRRMWNEQWRLLLDAGFRVVRCDFRAYGETPFGTVGYSPAEDVTDLLESLSISEYAIVGASYGGRIAQEIAAHRPDRVTRLAVVCGGRTGYPETPDVLAFGEAENACIEADDLAGAVELNVRTWVGPAASTETREFVGALQLHQFTVQKDAADVQVRHEPYDPASITAPTLVVSGAYDLPFFQAIADSLEAEIPDVRRVHLDWAGHLPSLESPTRFNPLLLDFLRSDVRSA
ncbi:alpha/beta fold hydrolase [Hamadaea tsunoensis]|uniref:alpha/beta fold hydrolase n=1 Tax=Hamadaea tsunoensis TaxID=53368 RepID=UPI0003F5DB7B|nr:alpha/beta fold hydrolase [Hamadaea tsunoensis]